MRTALALVVLAAGCGFSPSLATNSIDAAPAGDAAHDAQVVAGPDAKLTDAAVAHTDDFADVADTFLASEAPNTTFNQTSALADGDIPRVALYRFDLAAIATSATITAAELHIWTDFDPGDTCTFHQALESWDEATATWNNRSTGVAWTTVGAGAPSSRATLAVGTVDPTVANTGYVVTIDPAVVTTWVATPATNFGFVIATTQANGTRFTTREGTAGMHAFLRVTHLP